MATFDPYHIWLGIPPEDQPPSDYRLLAIPELESDSEVIHKAAAQQTIYLQMFQSGEHADLAEQLLKEISTARDSLLNRELKNKYGLQLKPEKTPVPSPSTTSDGQQPPASKPAPRLPIGLQFVPTREHIFHDTPYWIVSLLLHVFLLIFLGMLEMPREDNPRTIVHSLVVGPDRREGGDVFKTDPNKEIAHDLPIPENVNRDDPEAMEMVMHDQETARELIQDFDTLHPSLPRLEEVKRRIREARGIRTTILCRDPRIRVEMVTQEGGTTRTEAAVARGLDWLSRHQAADGRWSINHSGHGENCNCGNPGRAVSDSAATSLALLPFLGAGQTHLVGKYKQQIGYGLNWLVKNQLPDGDLSPGSTGNTRMYAHGQGAIVLCEAFMLSGDTRLRAPAQKAIDFIVKSQHEQGGWRYMPGQTGDTSVLGWQVMALQSARMAGFDVPPSTIQKAQSYLDQVQLQNGARYGYVPGQKPTHTMTAEGLLCRMYLGWTLETREGKLIEGGKWLLENHPPIQKPLNMYYLYYATQALHHIGGETWSKWNTQMRNVLVESQQTRGHMLGSWTPVDQHDRTGGRLFSTSTAICCLEVYYRQLPLFKRMELK